MLLTFSKTIFKERIAQGIKVHTIRDDKHNRWKVGAKIHFWMGNPRNTRGKTKPYPFAVGIVSRVESVMIDFAPLDWRQDVVFIYDNFPSKNIILKTPEELNAFAVNDGFDNWEEMKLWFGNNTCQYVGKIIFWHKLEMVQTEEENKLLEEAPFPCLDDNQECTQQCNLCKFVENGLKN